MVVFRVYLARPITGITVAVGSSVTSGTGVLVNTGICVRVGVAVDTEAGVEQEDKIKIRISARSGEVDLFSMGCILPLVAKFINFFLYLTAPQDTLTQRIYPRLSASNKREFKRYTLGLNKKLPTELRDGSFFI